MENITINQKQLFDVIKRTISQDAIIEINKEKIEKQDKEIQSYKNINKQSESDL